jgi:hypothetical protein
VLIRLCLIRTVNNEAPTSFCERLADVEDILHLLGTRLLRLVVVTPDKRLFLVTRILDKTTRTRNEEGGGREREVAGSKGSCGCLRGEI